MKKIITAIAAFTMAFALCSCGKSADSETAAAQPSEVTTAAAAATTAETAAVTTVPQSMTTTTAESETTTPENTTTTAEVTTTSDSTTTTAAENQTSTAKKKTTTAKQTTAAPKNTTATKQTAAPKQTTAASKQTSAPKQTTARQTTTAKKTTTSKQTTAPKRTTTAPKQTAAAKQTTTTEKKSKDLSETFAATFLIDYKAMRKKGQEFRNMSDYDKAVAVVQTAYDLGGETCIQYALNTYYLAEGAGLECYLVRSSDLDWYGHVANVAKMDGEYYYLEPQGNIVGAPHTFESHKELYANSLDKITDKYDNIISVTVADHWYNEEDGYGLIW